MQVVETLKKEGVSFAYDEPKGMDHGFDGEENVELEEAYAFVFKHL